MEKLKLFVWDEGIFKGYCGSGLCVVIASSKEDAAEFVGEHIFQQNINNWPKALDFGDLEERFKKEKSMVIDELLKEQCKELSLDQKVCFYMDGPDE